MILAAGRGERMRPLTDKVPKPLLLVRGRPLISHHLKNLSDAGFTEVVINLAHCGDMIRDTLGNGSDWGIKIIYSQEPPGALDTGGGISNALSLLGDTQFAVINGDVFTKYPMRRLKAIKCDHAHLVLVPNPLHNSGGDFALQGGRICCEVEPLYTFSGISIYHPGFFNSTDSGRFSVVPMLREAARLQRITGELFRGEWHDIGTPDRLQRINDEVVDRR
jgi:MurNAc alpha-1-phosphate uridylyltransferase